MVGFGGGGRHYCVLHEAISGHHFTDQGGMIDAQVLVVVFFAHVGLAGRADASRGGTGGSVLLLWKLPLQNWLKWFFCWGFAGGKSSVLRL